MFFIYYNRYVRARLKQYDAERCVWFMGALGAQTPKPSGGWFSDFEAADKFRQECFARLKRQKASLFRKPRAYAWGPRGDLRGNKLAKKSQAYTNPFCKLVLKVHGKT